MASCGRTPVSGITCVSHLIGSKTTPSVAAWRTFHSLITSVAIWRSSGMSEGVAMNTRYVVESNDTLIEIEVMAVSSEEQ